MSNVENIGDLKIEKWTEIFNELEKNYKEAYHSIDKAVKLDEEGKSSEALPLYESGLNLVEKALELSLNEPSKPDVTWEKAMVMTQKLRKTRKEILIRIDNIKFKPQTSAMELPPSYEDAVATSKSVESNSNGNTLQVSGPSTSDTLYFPPSALSDEKLLANLNIKEENDSNNSITYSDLSHQLKEMKLDKNEEILFHCDNVQLFFIAPDGRVSSTSEPQKLVIARVFDETSYILDEALLNIVSDLKQKHSKTKKKRHKHHLLHTKHHRHSEKKYKNEDKDEASDQSKRTFLQVGSWLYPLIPEVSPCYRSEIGIFMLPDINAGIDGAAVGIALPEESAEEFHELLTYLLNEIGTSTRSRRCATDYASDRFSSKIVRGAAYVAQSLVRGAGSTARFLDASTPRLINRITSSPDPEPVNPALQKTVEVAKTVSGKAVDITDYLATKIGMATASLGRYFSPYIQKQGTRILSSTTNMTEQEALEKINTLLSYTSDAVEGVSTIYSGLDTAASILAKSLANNTVQIIEHKYGQSAGALTNDAITTFGNVYYTHHNFRILRPKGIAKAAVRGAGTALLEDFKAARCEPHDEFRGSGPGDGSGFTQKA